MTDSLWYKDAVIYEVHVRAFADSNDDGIGDFGGLTRKLDYLQELGVTAIWLLPFYPSPRQRRRLRHRRLPEHPSRRTARCEDFQRVRRRGASARACASSPSSSSITPPTSTRGSRRARKAPIGHKKRDYYVWT